MPDTVIALATAEELFEFVHQTLCEQDQLDSAQCPLTYAPLLRRGKQCGLLFHVEGPRLLRTQAVWAADEQRILVYDSTGKRVLEYGLSESPELPEHIADTARRAA